MGVLKAKVGADWVPVGVGAGNVPPGGAAGTVLTKASAADGATQWSQPLVPQFAAVIAADSSAPNDAVWWTVPFGTIYVNVDTRYNGTYWAAPRAGVIRVTWSADLAVGTTPGNADAFGDYNANIGIYASGPATVLTIASTNSRFGACTLAGSTVISLAAGNTIYPQAWLNAPGKYKTVKSGVGSILIEYLT